MDYYVKGPTDGNAKVGPGGKPNLIARLVDIES